MSLPVSTPEEIQNFINAKDLSLLAAKPLVFERTEKVNSYYQCWGCTSLLAPLTCAPFPTQCVKACCPGKMYDSYYLQLDHNGIRYMHGNDCCCCVDKLDRTVPLNKVEGVTLDTGCILTDCYGLKKVIVVSGHELAVRMSNESVWVHTHEAVKADFLKDPDLACEAIRVAVDLYRQSMMPPQQQMMAIGNPVDPPKN